MDTPRDLVTRFYVEVINAKQLDALDVLVADDFIEHGKPPTSGREGFRAFVAGLAAAFPDVELEVDDWIVEGDRVVARCHVGGMHRGEFLGYSPTGHRVEWTAIHIWRVDGDRLAERWSEADIAGIAEQLQSQ